MRSGPYIVSVICQILIYCAVGEKIAEKVSSAADNVLQLNPVCTKGRKLYFNFEDR